MPYCPTCGTEVSGESGACEHCGSPAVRPQPITLFYSYAHEDEDLRSRLEVHLAALRRSGLIRDWHDHFIVPGQNWDDEIRKNLQSADLILFLISADFLNSNYIFNVEIKEALQRHRAGQAVVVPVILRPSLWQVVPELSLLQALPAGARPVIEWAPPDLAYVSICEGILAVIHSRVPKPDSDPVAAPSSPPSAYTRTRKRTLDAALPAKIPVDQPSTLLVMLRRTDSPGLRAIVEANPEYAIAAEDVDSKGVGLKFPLAKDGTPLPLDLLVRIESPQFDPPTQTKTIKIPPKGDSEPRVFLLTPKQCGSLVVNVEVYRSEDVIAGCVLRTECGRVAPSAKEIVGKQNVESAELPGMVEGYSTVVSLGRHIDMEPPPSPVAPSYAPLSLSPPSPPHAGSPVAPSAPAPSPPAAAAPPREQINAEERVNGQSSEPPVRKRDLRDGQGQRRSDSALPPDVLMPMPMPSAPTARQRGSTQPKGALRRPGSSKSVPPGKSAFPLAKAAGGLCVLLALVFGGTQFYRSSSHPASAPAAEPAPVESEKAPDATTDNAELQQRITHLSDRAATVNNKLRMMQEQQSALGYTLPADVLMHQFNMNMNLTNAMTTFQKGAIDDARQYADTTQQDLDFLEHFLGQ